MNNVKSNLHRVKDRIKEVSTRVGTNPAEIKLVAVTKGVSVPKILDAIQAGINIIGESRIQEAKVKYGEIKACVEFHLVGHLQRNKVKDAVSMFDLIHSVDTLALAKEINKKAAQRGKVQNILIEVNTSGEKTKFGITPSELEGLIKEIERLPNVNLQGLMTIAPLLDDPKKARPYFRLLRELNERFGLKYLSMGMSNDFEIAIEEGSNMLRIGRAIFEE